MNSIFRKGLFLVTVSGFITALPVTAQAAEGTADTVAPKVGIEKMLNNLKLEERDDIQVSAYLVPEEKGEYLDMAFADVDSFLYVRSEPSTDSEWVGKLYPGYAAKIDGPVGEWTKVESGPVSGYVYSEYILVGTQAESRAQELMNASDSKDPDQVFSYAEPRAEEPAQASTVVEQKTEAAQTSAGQSSLGQQVVDYACQFIGNPYVWGGTSLTDGADCSGFVQSVFSHFGVSLPRTTWDMESSGTEVSYDQAVAGDIILYDGHVGIYMGDGQIVNAIKDEMGIGILPATFTNIVTVRRLL